MNSLKGWRKKFIAGESLLPPVQIHKPTADEALRILGRLRLADVPGKPPMSEAGGKWFMDFAHSFLGAVDPETGARTIREAFILVPKKNSKTSYSALLMLTMLIMNKRPTADYVIISPTKTISDLAFSQAAGAIRADEHLDSVFWVRDNIKTIIDRRNDSKLRIAAAETNVVTGGKQTATLIDETHEMPTKANAKAIFTQLRGALMARRDGCLIQITTQSHKEPTGVFRNELRRARKVRDGKSDASLLPLLYEFPPDWIRKDKWRDPEVWHLVNPNAGLSTDLAEMRNLYEDAMDGGPEDMEIFCSQFLNVEIGTRQGDDGWIGARFWDRAADDRVTLPYIMDNCDCVTLGIDGGGREDLLGLAVLGRERIPPGDANPHPKWMLWTKAWAHEIILERYPRIADTLTNFQSDGDLVIYGDDDPQRDLEEVSAIANKMHTAKLLPSADAVGLDPKGVAAIVDAMNARGLDHKQLAAIRQGYHLNSAIIGTERKLSDGSLRHCGSPLMQWCTGNARIEYRGTAYSIVKNDSHQKIDPLMATFDAVYLMARRPEAGRNVYEEREHAVFQAV